MIIEAGVNLSLNEDTYIFVEKGNVQFLGKEELPININSSEVNNFGEAYMSIQIEKVIKFQIFHLRIFKM